MTQCEECGFGDGVHERGCWATMTQEQRESALVSRGWSARGRQ